jgi:hypothetical protein
MLLLDLFQTRFFFLRDLLALVEVSLTVYLSLCPHQGAHLHCLPAPYLSQLNFTVRLLLTNTTGNN